MSKVLTKHKLAKQLQNEQRFLWMTQKASVDIIETVVDLISCHFQNGGESVTLRGFGTFKRGKRAAFLGDVPGVGTVSIPEKSTITFKPSAELKRRLNY